MDSLKQALREAVGGLSQNFTVMLVDDDDVAVEGVLRGFRKNDAPWNVVTAEDGLEAIDILRGRHPTKQLTRPYLILLDLNMPRMDGFSFLETIRTDEALQGTVVFVLTTSALESDRRRAYREFAAGYIVKSNAGPDFAKLASLLRLYGEAVCFPERPA